MQVVKLNGSQESKIKADLESFDRIYESFVKNNPQCGVSFEAARPAFVALKTFYEEMNREKEEIVERLSKEVDEKLKQVGIGLKVGDDVVIGFKVGDDVEMLKKGVAARLSLSGMNLESLNDTAVLKLKYNGIESEALKNVGVKLREQGVQALIDDEVSILRSAYEKLMTLPAQSLKLSIVDIAMLKLKGVNYEALKLEDVEVAEVELMDVEVTRLEGCMACLEAIALISDDLNGMEGVGQDQDVKEMKGKINLLSVYIKSIINPPGQIESSEQPQEDVPSNQLPSVEEADSPFSPPKELASEESKKATKAKSKGAFSVVRNFVSKMYTNKFTLYAIPVYLLLALLAFMLSVAFII